jgi:hypothetical protein
MAVENKFCLTLDPVLARADFTIRVEFEVVAQTLRAGFEYLLGRIERHTSDQQDLAN